MTTNRIMSEAFDFSANENDFPWFAAYVEELLQDPQNVLLLLLQLQIFSSFDSELPIRIQLFQ